MKKRWIVLMVVTIILVLLGAYLTLKVLFCGYGGIRITDFNRPEVISSEKVSPGLMEELIKLFGEENRVRCLGEGAQEVKFIAGGRRKVICLIKEQNISEYELKVEVESLRGASNEEVQTWILDKDWSGEISPEDYGRESTVLFLDIPRDAPTTNLKITIDSVRNNDPKTRKRHISYIDVLEYSFSRKLNDMIC